MYSMQPAACRPHLVRIRVFDADHDAPETAAAAIAIAIAFALLCSRFGVRSSIGLRIHWQQLRCGRFGLKRLVLSAVVTLYWYCQIRRFMVALLLRCCVMVRSCGDDSDFFDGRID